MGMVTICIGVASQCCYKEVYPRRYKEVYS